MSERQELLRQAVLRVVRHCPQCQQPFDLMDIGLFGQLGETWLFALRCPACHVMTVVGLAVASPPEQPSEQEAPAKKAGPLTSDDVLEMHCVLERFTGDFQALLGKT